MSYLRFSSLLLFAVALLGAPVAVWALEIPSREVTLEWDEIQGAASYDVEVTRRGETQPTVVNSKATIWNGKLIPGFYQMRIRAKDRRQVPGDWSEPADLTVSLDPPVSNSLKGEQRLVSKSPDKSSTTLVWNPVPGADGYEVKVTGADGRVLQSFTTQDTKAPIELPVAERVKWSIVATGADGLVSEAPLQGEIEVWGPELAKPEITPPANKFVRELQWSEVPYASNFAYAIQRFDEKTKKWKSVHSEKSASGKSLTFSPSWPGGKYRVNLRSQGKMRKSSKIASLGFQVEKGDRSAAAEYRSMLRKSIVRTTGWFSIASYLITSMQYEGLNADNGGSTPLRVAMPNNLGGTGRVGLGYLSDQSPWGFLSILDMSGMLVGDKSTTYMSAEVNGIHRMVVGQTGEFRQQFGVFYKELPEIIALNLTGIDRIEKIAAAGPHYGVEYWWAMSPSFGLQVNAHVYASALSVKTPTGNPVTMSLSYQMGLLGSYRLTERATGLIGYAYRDDSQSYQSSGDHENSVKITGHYLNLFLEWAL